MPVIDNEGEFFTGSDIVDRVYVLASRATVRGVGGDDRLSASLSALDGALETTLDGADGADQIGVAMALGDYAGDSSLSSQLIGGAGDDDIVIAYVAGEREADLVTIGLASDVNGGTGHDVIDISAEGYEITSNDAAVTGGAGDDLISVVSTEWGYSTSGLSTTTIDGGSGADRITARTYSATGDVDFTITGGTGNDIISSTAQAVSDYSKDAANRVWGGDGDDRIAMVASSFSGAAVNVAFGEAGADTITADVGLYAAGTLRAELYGGDGSDRLVVLAGTDNLLAGNQGNDTLLGSAGEDRLIGGQGDDYLRGYGAADTFEFQSARSGERDRIADFAIGDDMIDLSRIDANVFRDGNQAFDFDGTGDGGTGRVWLETYGTKTVLHADTGRAVLDLVLLDGGDVAAGDYGAGDFLL